VIGWCSIAQAITEAAQLSHDLWGTVAILKGIVLLRIAEQALITTASDARQASLALMAIIDAVKRGQVTLFEQRRLASVEPPFRLLA
jgi:hypothetical protein